MNNDNNNGRNQEIENKEGSEINTHISSPEVDNICVSQAPAKTLNFVNYVNSASTDSDHGLNSAPPILISA